jgi:MFS family permease
MMPPTHAGVAARLGVFGHRPFAVFWFAGLLSNTGTWLQAVAASVVMYSLTGSAFMVGVLNFVGFLPLAVFSLAGGVASDRHDRRVIVVLTSLCAMAAGGALAVVAWIQPSGGILPAALIVGSFLASTCYAFAKPALAALVPALVPRDDLRQAIAFNSLQYTAGQLVGALSATVILTVAGPAAAFGANAVTFIGPILAMAFVPDTGARGGADDRSIAGGIAPAARYVRSDHRIIVALAGVAMGSATYEAMRTLSPVLAARAYGQPEEVAGVLIGVASLGSAIGTLAVGTVGRRVPVHVGVPSGFLLGALGSALMAVATDLPLALAGALLTGLAFALSFTLLTTLIQDVVPDALRGRVMAIHMLAHLGTRPFVALVAGTAAAIAGGRPAVLVMAVLLAGAAMWSLRQRDAPVREPQPDVRVPSTDPGWVAGRRGVRRMRLPGPGGTSDRRDVDKEC